MTDIYVKNRIEEIGRVMLSMVTEVNDPDSKGPQRIEAIALTLVHLEAARTALQDTIGVSE